MPQNIKPNGKPPISKKMAVFIVGMIAAGLTTAIQQCPMYDEPEPNPYEDAELPDDDDCAEVG